jgi:hypothetical protein
MATDAQRTGAWTALPLPRVQPAVVVAENELTTTE